MNKNHWRRVGAVLSAALTVAALSLTAGCGNDEVAVTGKEHTTPETTAPAAAAKVSVANAWVKATDTDMTGLFAEITNEGDTDITLEGATSDTAGMVELHEVVDDGTGNMVMQPKEGGFPIPAGETYKLEPGGDHIMMMMLKDPLKPGDKVTVTVTLSDGTTLPIDAVVKAFDGAAENYKPKGDGHEGMADDEEMEKMDNMDMESPEPAPSN